MTIIIQAEGMTYSIDAIVNVVTKSMRLASILVPGIQSRVVVLEKKQQEIQRGRMEWQTLGSIIYGKIWKADAPMSAMKISTYTAAEE